MAVASGMLVRGGQQASNCTGCSRTLVTPLACMLLQATCAHPQFSKPLCRREPLKHQRNL